MLKDIPLIKSYVSFKNYTLYNSGKAKDIRGMGRGKDIEELVRTLS